MTQEIFADAVGEVSLTGSVVRVDLVSLSATERDANNKPQRVFRQRIVMPIEGFLQSYALMSQVVQQLEKSGVIKKAEGKPERAAAAIAKPSSPNFK